MNKILENNTNKLIEKYLGVSNIDFKESFDRNFKFEEEHVKRSNSFYKKDKSIKRFGYITMIFEKNNKKFGIKINPEKIIERRKYEFEKDDFIEREDGRVLATKSFFSKGLKPILLPFQFYGETVNLSLYKLIDYLSPIIRELNN